MTSAIFIWSFIQSFVIGGIVGVARRTTLNYILSGIFMTMALNVLLQYFFRCTDLKYDYPQCIFVPDILDFLLPALVLWYVDRLLGQPRAHRYAYFLPAGVAGLVLFAYVWSQPDFTYRHYVGTLLHKGVLCLLMGWKAFVFYTLYRTLRSESILVAVKDASLLWWPRALTVFVGITGYITVVQLIHLAIFVPYLEANVVASIRSFVQLNYVLFNSSIILFTLYLPFKYPKVLLGELLVKPADASPFPESGQYCERLHRLVSEEHVYLNSELNEKALADRMEIPLYVLSRLLNEQLGKSFSEFINEKRVEAAQRMLEKDVEKKLTNLAVALDSGFGSESVFYVNFKKVTGTTPSQYRKHARKKQQELA